ncbi:phosphonate metabolism protein/1,5-bisphosphokinase (PRPP-forming) PhnN [Curvivirga sp.]|uniref:phosphonate metabolism protein/1,5-bisphosphokinase (PRPP-forming) PhnN n=1 Tax=Curvivirga sp. TaxID=2856848 RepID=UPI003B5B9090
MTKLAALFDKPQGTLFLVVGPSGSGKDSILNFARNHFSKSEEILFPRRYISRPMDAGGEDHLPITMDDFEKQRQAGQFTFHWRAHGLCYGIPITVEEAILAGRSVVVNVSRSILDEARLRFQNVVVLSVIVNEAELRKRLTSRGRETPEDVEKRLARSSAFRVSGNDVQQIDNSGELETSCKSFIQIVTENSRLNAT